MAKLSNILLSAALIIGLFIIAGCENDYPPSVYDPDAISNPAPVIESVDPPAIALSGVTKITILGKNFSPDIGKNVVFFDAQFATILEASETRLYIQAPIYVADTLFIRIAVQGAELFSNTYQYRLKPAQHLIFSSTDGDQQFGITTDAEGNLYASLIEKSVGVGIKKYTIAGVRSDYAPKGAETKYSALKMGPNGVLYGARILKGIFQITGPGKTGTTFASGGGIGTIYDLDFDADKNIWAVGNNDKIYRVTPAKNIKGFDFKADLRSVRVFEGYVYVAGTKDNLNKVWRFPLTGNGEAGAVEEYIDYTAATNGSIYKIYAITFAKDGDLYIGSDHPDGIHIVHPDKTVEPLYPGQFGPKTLLFSWGKDLDGNYNRLYFVKEMSSTQNQLYWADIQKEGAPYYGIM